MRTQLIVFLGLAVVLMGCGAGGEDGAIGAAETAPIGTGASGFCDAASLLQMADASNRQEIQAGLEAATPAGQEEHVAVIREFMERQARGDDPYKDPEFLLAYDRAARRIMEHCGTG